MPDAPSSTVSRGPAATGTLAIEEFTDPSCPFAFSAEPIRLRLAWTYGDALTWRRRMIVLSETPDDYVRRGVTLEMIGQTATRLQASHGMPIEPAAPARHLATIVACRAVVAARLRFPDREAMLLRCLRVERWRGRLIDEPDVVADAAHAAGIDAADLATAAAEREVETALRADMAAARSPAPAARALDAKLAGPPDERRYTTPSYVISSGEQTWVIAGFSPPEVYDVVLANLAPELPRRPPPTNAGEALAWAGMPLATAEVAMLRGVSLEAARDELEPVATFEPVGLDGYWTLA